MGDQPARLRELLQDVGQRLGLSAPAETGKLWARWPEIVGESIAQHAEPTSLRSGVLRVRADSSVWATEIRYLAAEIQERANTALGVPVVQEVRVWMGDGPIRRSPSPNAPARVESRASGDRISGDPDSAFSRARAAWLRRRSGASQRASSRPPENLEKPR